MADESFYTLLDLFVNILLLLYPIFIRYILVCCFVLVTKSDFLIMKMLFSQNDFRYIFCLYLLKEISIIGVISFLIVQYNLFFQKNSTVKLSVSVVSYYERLSFINSFSLMDISLLIVSFLQSKENQTSLHLL
jgi:hypothetical protein